MANKQLVIPRPVPQIEGLVEAISDRQRRLNRLIQELVKRIPVDPESRTSDA